MTKPIRILILHIIVLLISSCTTVTTTQPKKYRDFNHIDHWDQLESLTDQKTYLFYYSPYCEICKSLELEVGTALTKLEQQGYIVYLINEGFIYEQGTQPFELIEVPSVLVYQDKTFVQMVSGSRPILQFFASELQQNQD